MAHGYLLHEFLSPLANRARRCLWRRSRTACAFRSRSSTPCAPRGPRQSRWACASRRPTGSTAAGRSRRRSSSRAASRRGGGDWIDVSSGGVSPSRRSPRPRLPGAVRARDPPRDRHADDGGRVDHRAAAGGRRSSRPAMPTWSRSPARCCGIRAGRGTPPRRSAAPSAARSRTGVACRGKPRPCSASPASASAERARLVPAPDVGASPSANKGNSGKIHALRGCRPGPPRPPTHPPDRRSLWQNDPAPAATLSSAVVSARPTSVCSQARRRAFSRCSRRSRRREPFATALRAPTRCQRAADCGPWLSTEAFLQNLIMGGTAARPRR